MRFWLDKWEKVYEIIKKYPVVSFDVFDTLIKRSVAKPTDIFSLVEVASALDGFAQKRQNAQREAEEKLNRPETLDEIYDALERNYGGKWAKAMELEIGTELAGVVGNAPVVELFHKCIADNKTVVLISDMYLSAEIIATMLKKCNVTGYQKLYVSCECGVNKESGNIYRKMLQETGVDPKQIIHIGDHIKPDLLRPLQIGMHAIWLKNDEEKICRAPDGMTQEQLFQFRTMQACIRNTSVNLSKIEQQGCAMLGPLLFGFSNWLAKQLAATQIREVFFLARDGYMLKRAFDVLYPEKFKTHYLYGSKRSFIVPLLWKHPSMDGIVEMIGKGAFIKISMRQFLIRVGLEPDDYLQEARQYGIEMDRIYEKESFCSDPMVMGFYWRVRNDIEKNSRTEYQALLRYIQESGMRGKIALVDVGYYGTMQLALSELIKEENLDIQVKGYYMGVAPDAQEIKDKRIDAKGYLYDVGRENEVSFVSNNYFLTIYEAMFLAPHGSVKKFRIDNNTVKPSFCDYEYEGHGNEQLILEEYREGAMALVRYLLPFKYIYISPAVAVYKLMRMGTSPKLDEAKLWGDFRYLDQTVRYIARPQYRLGYIFHIKQLRNDFLLSSWRIGFLRRMLLLPLPYVKIIDTIKKIYYREPKT